MNTSGQPSIASSFYWLIAVLADAPPFATTAVFDEALLVRQAQEDLGQFGQLYECYMPRVYRYLLGRVGNVADAQDLTSQTFIAAMENLNKYKGQRPFLAWLFGIARNKATDHFRQLRPDHQLETAVALADNDTQDPSDIVQQQLTLERVAGKLQAIAPDRAEAILLRLVAGLSVTEVAALMDKNEPAVRMLLHRGLRDLQTQLVVVGEDVL